ncbi:hypothetical protein M885DRAFT_528740 [Pelagophyceae sp. CCMP2097]|nr:hypothetical protein M885DRAFT_528740 [Pelagophyceae sp. CCMP2097]
MRGVRSFFSVASAMSTVVQLALLVASCTALQTPGGRRLGQARPSFAVRRGAEPPATPPTNSEAPMLAATGLTWAAVGGLVSFSGGENSKWFVTAAFGLATATFEDTIREPASGFLELTAPLFILEGVLLLALSRKLPVFSPDDQARLGVSLGLTSVATLAALTFVFAQGADLASPEIVAGVVALVVTTALLGFRSVLATGIDDVAALLRTDAVALLSSGGGPFSVAGFYRSSCLVGVLVGAAFAASPVDPIGFFDSEGPVTLLMRQLCGVYITFLLCPVESILFRNAKQNTLGAASARFLNAATGLASFLLVVDGRVQSESSAANFKSLEPGSELLKLVETTGDAARSQINTNAAFAVGLLVAVFYLFQAANAKNEGDPDLNG